MMSQNKTNMPKEIYYRNSNWWFVILIILIAGVYYFQDLWMRTVTASSLLLCSWIYNYTRPKKSKEKSK